ncbi:MAG: CpaD family pilus assembly protein [Rhizobiaceae bacterium]
MSAKRLIDRSQPARRAVVILAIAGLALASGCAKRDSITVGSVPDDYRTNHPIVVGEKDEIIDLPVGASDRGMTRQQKASVEGFLHHYDRQAAPVLTILAPYGAANDVAAGHAASDFAALARRNGVPEGRIIVSSYDAGAADVSAPVRLSYKSMRAQVAGKCGRWPADMLADTENKHWANFGCSYQNNLAAQMANPEDLLGPRKQTEIDATKRGVAIDVYQNTPTIWEPEILY